MFEIQSHEMEYERFFDPLIKLATTDHWKEALNILYCNGDVLDFGEGIQTPVLISKDGDDDNEYELTKVIDLLKSSSNFNQNISTNPSIGSLLEHMIPLLGQVVPLFFPKNQHINKENVTDLFNQKKLPASISGILIQSAFLLSQTIAVEAFSSLREKRKTQIDNTLDEFTYEEMIDDLEKIEVIESQLSVSICPHCTNYHITLSPHPWVEEDCSKCGEIWTTYTLYIFSQAMNWFKTKNSDLPLFISSYLRYKLSEAVGNNSVEIYPNAKISANEKVLEVDVYLPQFTAGIECKLFQDWSSPPTSDRVNGLIGKFIPQIANYVELGIKHMVFVTNLPIEIVSKLLPKIQESISAKNLKLDSFNIIARDINNLIQSLDETSGNLVTYLKNVEQPQNPEQSET